MFVLLHALTLTTLLTLLTGCIPRPLHGGRALTTGPITQSLSQTENPSAPSSQSQETIKTRTYTIPSLNLNPNLNLNPLPLYSGIPLLPNQNSKFKNQNSSPAPSVLITEHEESRARTELGPAQHDSSRELAAKLSSLKSITWVGVALFIFGLASLFWPPLQTIIGSVTTSVAIILGGLSLIILPTLVVGNELLILAGVMVAVGAWFLAHRHGHLRGIVSALHTATPKRPSSK